MQYNKNNCSHGQLVIVSWKRACSCIMFGEEFFGETSNRPGDSAPYSPDLAYCSFWLFPKLKLPLKRKRFQTIDEIQENTTRQLMVIGRTLWGPKVPTLKGLKHHCPMYNVSYSCIFFGKCLCFSITWLDTFWTHLLYIHNLYDYMLHVYKSLYDI